MKKISFALFIVFSFFSFAVIAQVPEPVMLSLKGYGGNGASQVVPNVTKTQDGGFIVCISSNSTTGTGNIDSLCSMNGSRMIYLKYNADGSILEWSKCFRDGPYIFPQNDGTFIQGGTTTAVPAGWAFKILKVDSLGTILWRKTYGGQVAGARLFDMISTDDGGYIMMGETNYADTDFTIHYGSWMDDDIAVIKLDSNGNKVWSKVIGGSAEDAALSIVKAPGDGCYILGTTLSTDYDCIGNHGGDDIYLARLDKDGNFIWHHLIGGSGGENGSCAFADRKGGIIIAGASNSLDGDRTVFPSYGCPIWALQVDSNNHILWNNCYGGGGLNCYANAICKGIDGSIWIAGVSTLKGGQVDTGYGTDDAFFLHTDSGGNVINAKVLGSSQVDRGMMVYPLSNGNIIAGGFYEAAGGTFPNIYYGIPGSSSDAFLTIFEPWSTGIKHVISENDLIEIYPNPTDKQVTIEFLQKNNYTIIITDVLGQIVYQASFIGKTNIVVNEWRRGLYYVQVISDNGFKTLKKLLVE